MPLHLTGKVYRALLSFSLFSLLCQKKFDEKAFPLRFLIRPTCETYVFFTHHIMKTFIWKTGLKGEFQELNFLRCCMTCFPTALLQLNIRAAGHIYTNQKTPISDVLQHRFKTSQSRLISNFILQAPSSPPSGDRAEPLVFLCVALHP